MSENSDLSTDQSISQSNKRKRTDTDFDEPNKKANISQSHHQPKPKVSQPGFKRTGIARNRSTNQSSSQSSNQSSTQSVSQLVKPKVKRSVNQSTNQPNSQSNNESIIVPKGCFTVFVGGLPYNTTKQAITNYFNRNGCHVWNVKIAAYQKANKVKQPINQTKTETDPSVSQSIDESANQSVNQSVSQSVDQSSKQTIDQSISQKFADQQRGFAHVEFENEQQVEKAIKQWHNQLWTDGEHIISVAVAKPKPSTKQSTKQPVNQSNDEY
jgi:RNA recognition motif-containing protein